MDGWKKLIMEERNRWMDGWKKGTDDALVNGRMDGQADKRKERIAQTRWMEK